MSGGFKPWRIFPLAVVCLSAVLLPAYSDAARFDLVTHNLNRLFDDKDDGNREKVVSTASYRKRLQRIVDKISTEYAFAEVIAFQEVENIDILQDISDSLRLQHRQNYRAILIEGNDSSGIDVGYLVKQPLQIKRSSALFQHRTYGDHQDKLFARPPLLLEVCGHQCLIIVNLHLRSMRGLRSPVKGQRVAHKRRLQAETLARWINRQQQLRPQQGLIITGDFNALQPSDAYVDSLGTILGQPDQRRPRWQSPDLIDRDLIDISRELPLTQRYSYLYKGQKQQLDYILVSQNLAPGVTAVEFGALDYNVSDHAALRASFALSDLP